MHHKQPIYNLYALRTAIHLSAERVAAACGICVQTYYHWEQGKTNPSQAHRRKLARILRVSDARLREGSK